MHRFVCHKPWRVGDVLDVADGNIEWFMRHKPEDLPITFLLTSGEF